MAIVSKRIHPQGEERDNSARASSQSKKKALLYHHGQRTLVGSLVLSILLLTVGGSMIKTHQSISASNSAFTLLDKSLKFTTEYAAISTEYQLLGLVLGFSDQASIWQALLHAIIQQKIILFQDFEKRYRHHKRKSFELRKANSKFEELSRLFGIVIEEDILAIDLLTEFRNYTNVLSFDAYILALETTPIIRDGVEQYDRFQAQLSKFTDELKHISVTSQTDTQRVTLAVQFLLFIVLLGLALSLHNHFKESSIKLAAQDKLLRQQMHEARNKFCPAMYMMEHFLETAQHKDATVQDFKSQADDMHMALVALKEVEAQHQARLDMYKILQGKYVANKETFDILELMRERSNLERTVALARARATNSPIATFVSAIEDATKPQHNECAALFIQTDLYILNHVIANLLSNARKFCSSGEIKVCFNGASSGDLLVFSVRDSGSGLPTGLDGKKLFSQGVLSGDTRGTGLGLSSCHLFCKAGGGYIRLIGTKQIDEHSSGYTEFEFALQGKIIRADKRGPSLEETPDVPSENLSSHKKLTATTVQDGASPPPTTVITPPPLHDAAPQLKARTCPENVQVVAIDDSALNRTCVLRSFKKIERASNAKHWIYKEYETIESSMPFFRGLQDSSKVIVVLDENLGSRGGVLRGIQGTRWLLHELHFSGIIISTSGDPDVGREHLQEGPNVMNWGKPLPKFETMLDDVTKALDPTLLTKSSTFS